MPQKLLSIQILRAVAVFLVLQAHFFPNLPVSGRPFSGGIGVDLFFVISGYVIAGCLRKVESRTDALNFLTNRFSRVAPYYWILTGVCVLGFDRLGYPTDPAYLVRSLAFYPVDAQPVLGVGWTLCHEAFFYLFCGLCAATLGRGRPQLTILVFGGTIAAAHAVPGHAYPLEFIKASMNFYFVVGALVNLYEDRLVTPFRSRWGIPAAILFAALVVSATRTGGLNLPSAHDLAISLYRRDEVYFTLGSIAAGVPRFLAWSLPSALLLVTFLARESSFTRENSRFLLQIGDASYSIYLLQGVLMSFVVVDVVKNEFLSHAVLLFIVVSLSLLCFPLESWLSRICRRTLRWPGGAGR